MDPWFVWAVLLYLVVVFPITVLVGRYLARNEARGRRMHERHLAELRRRGDL